jgi:hypothetical protein
MECGQALGNRLFFRGSLDLRFSPAGTDGGINQHGPNARPLPARRTPAGQHSSRPLEDAERPIDVIVVYKVDRLTRSLAVLAKLVMQRDRRCPSLRLLGLPQPKNGAGRIADDAEPAHLRHSGNIFQHGAPKSFRTWDPLFVV